MTPPSTFLVLAFAATFAAAVSGLLLWRRERRLRAHDTTLAAAWQQLSRGEGELLALREAHAPGPARDAIEAALTMQHRVLARVTRARAAFDPARIRETRLLGLQQDGTHYALGGLCMGRLDLEALDRSGRIAEVGPLGGPPEFAALIARDNLRAFLLPEDHPWALPTSRWLARLPAEVSMVLVHLRCEGEPTALHVVAEDEAN